MTETARLEPSDRQYYRPDQVAEMQDEEKRITATLNGPPHVQSSIQDPGHMVKDLRRIRRQLEEQAPRPYDVADRDRAVAKEQELREKWLEGMPTHSEMRRNPAGAVDKHRSWDFRTKDFVLEWKNVCRRLHASGMIDGPADARDISNVEMYRPWGGAQEMNLDNPQIDGLVMHMPPGGPTVAKPFTKEKVDQLRELAPDLVDKLAVMDGDQRAAVMAILESKPPSVEGSYKAVKREGARWWDVSKGDVRANEIGLSQEDAEALATQKNGE